MTTFKVYHELDVRRWRKDEVEQQVGNALEFNSYKVYIDELAGCYMAITMIQFSDEDDAVMFRLKYGDTWNASAMLASEFREGHKRSYVGG
jgi:hypothetical protein